MSLGLTVVLASASPIRRRLLEAAGVALTIAPARIDEDEIKRSMIAEGADGAAIAEALAELKARAVSRTHPGLLVIGADQVLEHDGTIFSKPTDREAARVQLVALRGGGHMLIDCVCVLRDGERLWHRTESARLRMRDFSDGFLDAYLDEVGDQAFDGPGAYRLEGLGAQLFDRIDGDYFTILGLPLLALLDYLRVQGVIAK